MLLRLALFSACLLAATVPASAAEDERLMLGELRENEAVVIDYLSVTGQRTVSRQYFIRGGETKLLTVHRNLVEWRNRVPHVVNKHLLGDLVLSPDDVLGLEALLVFYAARLPGACGTRDTVQVEFYRDGKVIGRFNYQDDTCFTRDKDSAATRAKTRGRVNDSLMDVLVTFAQIDEQVRAANP